MTTDYIIYAVMGAMFLYTLIHFEIIDHRYNKARTTRERRTLDREYKIVGTSMLVQLGCIFIASLILF